MKLTHKQTEALDVLEDTITTELIFGGGAGGAKSVLGCHWVTKNCLKYPRVRYVIGRAVLKTLKETTLNSLWWVFRQQGLKQNIHYKYNTTSGVITFNNNSEILLKDLKQYPKDPDFDELGSLEITGAFVDECNQIVKKAWDILRSRIRYRLDEYGLVPKILGTCNPAKNWVYVNFYTPWKSKELGKGRQFIQSLLDDNPYISKHYKDNLLSLDQTSRERLLLGNWEYDDDPSVLCSYQAVQDLFLNTHVEGDGEIYLSADLAMQGRDKFVAGKWDGLICSIVLDKKKATGKEIEENLTEIIDLHWVPRSHVVADSDGLGAFLESYLSGIKEFHGNAKANNQEFANIKSECGFKLAELINKRLIRVICTPEQKELLTEELGVLRRDNIDADDARKRIIKKDLMKETLGRSPDYLDMLIMRMIYEIKPEIYGYAG